MCSTQKRNFNLTTKDNSVLHIYAVIRCKKWLFWSGSRYAICLKVAFIGGGFRYKLI